MILEKIGLELNEIIQFIRYLIQMDRTEKSNFLVGKSNQNIYCDKENDARIGCGVDLLNIKASAVRGVLRNVFRQN